MSRDDIYDEYHNTWLDTIGKGQLEKELRWLKNHGFLEKHDGDSWSLSRKSQKEKAHFVVRITICIY